MNRPTGDFFDYFNHRIAGWRFLKSTVHRLKKITGHFSNTGDSRNTGEHAEWLIFLGMNKELFLNLCLTLIFNDSSTEKDLFSSHRYRIKFFTTIMLVLFNNLRVTSDLYHLLSYRSHYCLKPPS